MQSEEKLLYDGFHKIVRVAAEMKGRTVEREKILIKSAVAGIVVDAKQRLGLVTQFRPTINKTVREIPAGLLDKPQLTAVQTLIEELNEECNIPLHDVEHVSAEPLHEYYMVIGSSDATVQLYYVEVAEQQNQLVEDADVESVEWVTVAEMEQLVLRGEIMDPKTLLAFHIWKEKLAEGEL